MKSFFILVGTVLILSACGKGTDSSNQKLTDGELPAAAAEIVVNGSQDVSFSGRLSGKAGTSQTESIAPLSYIKVSAPQNGQVTLDNATGKFTYIPNPGYAGVDSFTYRVFDGTNYSPYGVGGIVTIKVAAKIKEPVKPIVNPVIKIYLEEDFADYQGNLKQYVQSECDPSLLSFVLVADPDQDGWVDTKLGNKVKLLNSAGDFKIALKANLNGNDFFQFVVWDRQN